MLNILIVIIGKTLIFLSNILNLGSGSTWPGHIALILNKNFIGEIIKNSKIKVIIVAGTNGKTTTARMITSIIRENGNTYLQNKAGANLINGFASAIIKGSNLESPNLLRLNQDYLIFESDENALPQILKQTKPDYIIALNLFRDQLDRYGEVDSIAKKWHGAFEKLSNKTTLILNADDPQIAFLGKKTQAKITYFGLEKKEGNRKIQHGADSTHCPNCSEKLDFSNVFFSHLGIWKCHKCGLERPKTEKLYSPNSSLTGDYNKYNSLAAALFAKKENIDETIIENAFLSFTPAFGRQEKLKYKGKNIHLFLSKNPTSFNESLKAIRELKGINLLILLNDRIPDGLDISWIWDINFEHFFTKEMNIGISGDRAFEMSLRFKYSEIFTHTIKNPQKALDKMIDSIDKNETLYIIPNYSAMLDIRKIITGKKIL